MSTHKGSFKIIVQSCCSAAQSYPTLQHRGLYRLPGSSVHGVLQARILEWGAIPPPWDLPDPGMEPTSPAWPGRLFTVEPLVHMNK